MADQEAQVELLKSAPKRLEVKLAEARNRAELLIVQHRLARAVHHAARFQQAPYDEPGTFRRMTFKVNRDKTMARAEQELLGDQMEDRFGALEREQKIDALLDEIKAKKLNG